LSSRARADITCFQELEPPHQSVLDTDGINGIVQLFSGFAGAQHRAVITEEETFKADEDSEETMVQMLYTWGRGNEGQTGVQRISGREKK
jgi:hypothetical protein